jgi:hypothetical protein
MVATVCLFAASAWAQTYNMAMTGPGAGNVLDGVYTSPYTGTVNGVTTSIICDAFVDDSYLGETWLATESNVANLASNVRWASDADEQQTYNEAAWLAEQLLLPANSNPGTIGDISFAIWYVTDPTDVANYLTNVYPDPGTLNAAKAWVHTASEQSFAPGEFANVQVFTAVPGSGKNCNGGPCAANSPQEFLVVHAAETSAPLLLAADLLGLLLVIGFLRLRSARTENS